MNFRKIAAVILTVSVSLMMLGACGSILAPIDADVPSAINEEAGGSVSPAAASTDDITDISSESGAVSAEDLIPGEDKAEGQLGSWPGGGTDASAPEGNDYAYDAALFIGPDGIDTERSSSDRISSGSFGDDASENIDLLDKTSGRNGILIFGRSHSVSRAIIEMLSSADGSDTCELSGKGSALAVFGSTAKVRLSDSYLHTSGVGTTPVFADSGATVTVMSSVLQSDGGTLYSEYMNTSDRALAVAPPWTLGIMGTARCINVMGSNTTVNLISSAASASSWGVLSSDPDNSTVLNVYDSDITLNNSKENRRLLQAGAGQISETLDNPYTVNYGSGYGSSISGGAVETFAGSRVFAGTYAAVLAGGSAVYTNLESGRTYELYGSSGEIAAVYTPSADKNTQIRSDTFGFMAYQGSNSLTIGNATTVDSAYASFLVKTGNGDLSLNVTVDESEISNGGVLIQIMDSDASTAGGMMDINDPLNSDHGSENYIPYHDEAEGFITDEASSDGSVQIFSFTNGGYYGNIYNASGSNGLKGSTLNVTFGEGTVYKGAIACTAAVHTTYDGSIKIMSDGGFAFDDPEAAAAFAEIYQNTHFTIKEYWNLGHVANLVNANGANVINVTLTDDALWQVTGTTLISSLTLYGNAKITVPAGIILEVNGTVFTDCTITASSLASAPEPGE